MGLLFIIGISLCSLGALSFVILGGVMKTNSEYDIPIPIKISLGVFLLGVAFIFTYSILSLGI